MLSRLFRRLFLEQLRWPVTEGELQCHGDLDYLTDATTFAEWLKPLRQVEWVVCSKRPFAGPEAVLSYLSCYTHRVAISNSRLLRFDDQGDIQVEGLPCEGPCPV